MRTPSFTVKLHDDAGHVRVALIGELDTGVEAEAATALEGAADRGAPVVLDLRGLDVLDSSGIKLVLVWARRLREREIGFSVVRGAPHVHRPFVSAGLEGLLPFVDAPPT